MLSRYYNTEERLTTLLRKVSNEVITRCCATIDLELVFHGNVFKAMESLHQSIDSGVQWRKIYQKAVQSIKDSVSDKRRHWNFDDASIFAQLDAFCSALQRSCRDL